MESNVKKISVLVTLYNVEKYIERCIKSVQDQTYSNFELILVDDGSTDQSNVICQKIAQSDPRIILIRQENSGAVCARRTCIKNATGDYYVFLDSDDYLEPNALEIILTSFEKYRCDCVIYGCKICSETSGRRIVEEPEAIGVPTPFFTSNRKDFLFRIFVNSFKYNALWRKAVKANILPKDTDYSRFYNISKANDLIQSLEIYSNVRTVAFIDAKPYIYVARPGSLTSTFSIERIKHLLIVLNVTFDYLQNEAALFTSNELLTLKYHTLTYTFTRYMVFVCNSRNNRADKIRVLDQMFQSEYFSKADLEYARQKKFAPFKYRALLFLFRHKAYRSLTLVCNIFNVWFGTKRLISRMSAYIRP